VCSRFSSVDPISRFPSLAYTVEKRDLRRWASSFFIAAYCIYASFLRIRPPCISSFLTSLPAIDFINGLAMDPFERSYLCCCRLRTNSFRPREAAYSEGIPHMRRFPPIGSHTYHGDPASGSTWRMRRKPHDTAGKAESTEQVGRGLLVAEGWRYGWKILKAKERGYGFLT